MMQDYALACLLTFRVMSRRLVPGEVSERFPDLAIVQIMVAQDQPFAAVEPVKNLLGAGLIVAAEIAEMPDDIVWSNDRVPSIDDELIHLIRGNERTKVEHTCMPKVGVAGKEMLSKRHS